MVDALKLWAALVWRDGSLLPLLSRHTHARASFAGRFICIASVYCFATRMALAGSIFVSGHDADYHALLGPNTVGARHFMQEALDFVRNGNRDPILLLLTSTANDSLGDHADSEIGLLAAGYRNWDRPGNYYVTATASQFLTLNLSHYSAILIPSDHGGSLTGDDLQAIDSRANDIISYLNAGGGLFALAEDGDHTRTSSGADARLFGFLPFLATSAPKPQNEQGYSLSAFGSSLGLFDSDVNGNFSHNVFTSTGGMTPVDFDASGEPVSLAYRGTIDPQSVPDAASTLTLILLALTGCVGIRISWKAPKNQPEQG